MRRIMASALMLSLLALVMSCGSEAPSPGNLTVTSTPSDVAITLDGTLTEFSTPHTFADLESGTYTVSIGRDGWVAFPAERNVSVPFGGSVTASFELSQDVGSLAVTSTPVGGAIFIDGEGTGEVTPFTFSALVAGDYEITVELENYASDPSSENVTVLPGEEAAADFTLVQVNIPRIVVIEGFSNLYCPTCAALATYMEFIMHEDGYGPERMLYVKWPSALNLLDPFYFQIQGISDVHTLWYNGGEPLSLPAMTGNGEFLGTGGTPLNADGIMNYVDSQSAFADFAVEVATTEDLTDVDDLTHEATITLYSPAGTDLSDYSLHVVLLHELVNTEYEYHFGHGDEFHWVTRDHVVVDSDLGVLAPFDGVDLQVTLSDPMGPTQAPGHDIYPVSKQIVAFVQNNTTRTIVQAGSTLTVHNAVARPGSVPGRPAMLSPEDSHD